MGWVRYDSYTDKFIYEEDLISTTATCTGCIQKPFEITEEVIEKIADAVVRKLADRKTENNSKIPNCCLTCKHKDKADNDFPCVKCFYDDTMYEAEDKPQTDCGNKTIEEISHECVGLCNIREKRKHCDLIKTKPQTNYGDYERAVEQIQYDMRYESTYNVEDGSM